MMRKPPSNSLRITQAGKAVAYLLGAVMLVALALLFTRLRRISGGGTTESIELPPGMQADLQRSLEHWAAALKTRDLTSHIGFYRDPAQYFGRSRTRQEIWLLKKKLLDAHPAINVVEISDLKVEKFDAGAATLAFTLRYDYGPGGAPPQSGKVLERLICRSSGNDWKIESEYIDRDL
jgi:hypothetical protein